MASTLFLLFPLLFVGVCEARNATSIDGSNHNLPTFFGTAPVQNKIMAVCRLNHRCLFFQIPPWIKEERVASSRKVTTFSFGHALRNMSGNTLFTAACNENKRETFHPLDPRMIQTTLTRNRTINGSQKPYLKKYLKDLYNQRGNMALDGSLETVCRKGLNVAGVQNESASTFWIFLDFQSNAFPHLLVSQRSSHPTLGLTFHQKLNNQKSADGAWHVSSFISLCFFFLFILKRIKQDKNDSAKEKRSEGMENKTIKWWTMLLTGLKAKTPQSQKHLRNQKNKKQTSSKRKQHYRQKKRRRSTIEQCWSSWSLSLLFLFLFVSEEFIVMVDAVCAPSNIAELIEARDLCFGDTSGKYGYCYSFAKQSNSNGCNDGGENGLMGDWDISKLTSLNQAFYDQTTFNADISKWDTSSVISMEGTFHSATAFNSDISKWDTSRVTTMDYMFSKAFLFNGNVAKFNTSRVTTMSYMFSEARDYNGDISKWDTSSVTSMSYMFNNALVFNSDISKWDTHSVTNMKFIFCNSAVTQILCGGAWLSIHRESRNNAFSECDPGSSFARYGCCAAGSFISNPDVGISNPGSFNTDGACSQCPAGQLGATIPNADLTCPGTCQTGESTDSPGRTLQSDCIQCAVGLYSNKETEYICTTCPKGYESIGTDVTQCSVCGFSKYQEQDDQLGATCLPCPINTYQADDGKAFVNHDNKTEDCIKCPDSLFSKVGDQGCSACAAGQTAGNDSCVNCPVGQVSSSNTDLKCKDCDAGYYQSEKGLPLCIRCIPGRYQNSAGEIKCKACLRGRYDKKGILFVRTEPDVSCEKCPIGYYQIPGGHTFCLPCLTGKYQDKIGRFNCTECPKGYSNSATNAQNCSACDVGKYNTQSSQSSCKGCQAGKWSDAQGSTTITTCKNCVAGKYSSATGAFLQTDCNGCPPGKASNRTGNTKSTDCISCKVNTIAQSSGTTECTTLRPGTVALSGGAAWVQVPDGSYITNDADLPFLACPMGWIGDTPPSTTCQICEAGQASSSGALACQICEAGKFSNLKGSPNCTACDIEFKEYSENAGSSSCAVCNSKQSSIGTKCTAIPIDATLTSPTNVELQRLNVETFNQLNISWTLLPINLNNQQQTSTDDITAFTLQISTDPEFRDNENATDIKSKAVRHIVVPTINMADIRTTVHYVKIRSVGTSSTQVSEWSASTAKWLNTGVNDNSCRLETQYLDTSSLVPGQWECKSCPRGGSCSGSLTFYQVDAKFGWSQCPSKNEDNKNDTKKFAECMFAPACLGGTNTALLNKYKLDSTVLLHVDPALCEHNNCTAGCSLGYANGSRLCGQCDNGYSHDGLTGQCDKCPTFEQNVGIAAAGLICGILGLVVLIQITLSDGGMLDESDGVKVSVCEGGGVLIILHVLF